MSTGVRVRESDSRDRDIRAFFRGLGNVPTPEYGDFTDAYEAVVPVTEVGNVDEYDIVYTDDDDDPEFVVVGMAVVDDFTKPLLYGVAVLPEYREQGIAGRLVERCVEAYDRLYCRVRKDNPPAVALFDSSVLEQQESMWPNELWRYETSDA